MDNQQILTKTLIWDDWHSQIQHSIKTVEELEKYIKVSDTEKKSIAACAKQYRWLITPYYASLMDPNDDQCPIRLQSIPNSKELMIYPNASVDPVREADSRKTRRIVHKYPDRAIILASDNCGVYCRHCTRKFHTSDFSGTYYGDGADKSWERDFEYLENTPQIRDVLITGGDPLILSDRILEKVLNRLRNIQHIEIIRIGSRLPVVLPQRITPELCQMLEKYHPVWFNTQFNHPKEITDESAKACDLLIRHGIPVQNQSVLLKNINDDVKTMHALLTGLLKIRVRPYYLYHCDNAIGVSHFATTLETGHHIMDSLFGFMTGFAVPQYILTTPLGKIPLEKEKFYRKDDHYWVLNYQGKEMMVDSLLVNEKD